jgi:hypothetical protein
MDVWRVPATRVPRSHEIVIGAIDVRRGAALPTLVLLGLRCRLLLDLRDVVVAQHRLLAKGGRPLERGHVGEAPRALEIRLAVRCARMDALAVLRACANSVWLMDGMRTSATIRPRDPTRR